MDAVLFVTLLGIIAIALCGFIGRRRPSATLTDWTVGGRTFGVYTMWFLQAGEVFTTFTFLAVAGLAFSGGAAATYAIPYLPIAFIGCYFLVPRVWALGKRYGYLTQADYFAHRYRSKAFGRFVAVIAVVFLLPYLQLQITGLGLVVQLVTGSAGSGRLSMILATVLTVAFVLWSGLRGIANTAYLKDALMLIAMLVLVIGVPLAVSGGLGPMFDEIATRHQDLLVVHDDAAQNRVWWVTSILTSVISVGCLTTAHQWPAYLAAKNRRTLRQNFIWMPMYQIVIILPVVIGFAGVLALPADTASNGVLLTLAGQSLPTWLTGVIAVAAAASAMVPAGTLCLGISSLVAHNIVDAGSERTRLRINHAVVVLAAGAALWLGLNRPDLLANLLLLTFSGLCQLAPALLAVIGTRRLLSLTSACGGMIVGVGVLIWLTFDGPPLGGASPGVIAVLINLLVAVAVEGVLRAAGASRSVLLDPPEPMTAHTPKETSA